MISGSRVAFNIMQVCRMLEYTKEVLNSGRLIYDTFIPLLREIIVKNTGKKFVEFFTSNTMAHACLFEATFCDGDVLLYQGNGFPTPAFMFEKIAGNKDCAALDWFDINPWTLDPDLNQIEEKLDQSKYIIAVEIMDTGGRIPSNIKAIKQVCEKSGIILLDDMAHAFLSERDGIKAGQIADVSILSFSATKLFTCGEGGALISNRELDDAVQFAQQGKRDLFGPTICEVPGYSCKFDEIRAALGCANYPWVKDEISYRKNLWRQYHAELHDVIYFYDYGDSNFYKLMVMPNPDRVRDFNRNDFRVYMLGKGIQLSAGVYDYVTWLQDGFGGLYSEIKLPGTELFCEKHFCLPIHSGITEDDCAIVCTAVRDYFSRSK